MDAIGGYFELEIRPGKSYHPNAIKLNTARNCLEAILIARKWRRVYLPFYSCEALLQPIIRQKVKYTYYPINYRLEPELLPDLDADEAFLYINYFGIKQSTAENLAQKYGYQLIVDNSQSFFSPRLDGIDTFYSPRKFFGVPDGGYIYSDVVTGAPENRDDSSWIRMMHLCKRIEFGAEAGYQDFRKAEEELDNAPVKGMSILTQRLLESIDYEQCARIRRANFSYLFDRLSDLNRLDFSIDSNAVPMVFPLLSDTRIMEKLHKNRIYVASYWKNLISLPNTMIEHQLSRDMVPIPIDQRYSKEEMDIIIRIIKDL